MEILIERLELTYQSSGWKLSVPDLKLLPNCALSLFGENMSGKSSFLSFLHGIFSGSSSWDRFIAQNRRFSSYKFFREGINSGLITQSDPLFESFSVSENLELGTNRISLPKSLIPFLGRHCRKTGLPGLPGESPVCELSSGARALVRSHRTFFNRPDLILLDEPVSNLDTRRREEFWSDLDEYSSSDERVNSTIILVSHYEQDHERLREIARNRNLTHKSLSIVNGVLKR